jgi:antitoxin VapB
MSVERQVRIFRNGRNQAVRIPREFELRTQNAVMRKEGEKLMIPLTSDALLARRQYRF